MSYALNTLLALTVQLARIGYIFRALRLTVRLSGIADLPLHDGHVPQWLITRMRRLASLVLVFLATRQAPGETAVKDAIYDAVIELERRSGRRVRDPLEPCYPPR
jgi:hypothetical protein